jgi:hypothetical protein
MFGSDNLPLGPNGQFPRQRISSAGNEIAAPESMEGVYMDSSTAKLPVLERDFHSSLNKVKGRMKQGRIMRQGQDADKFRPRSAGRSKVKGDNWLRQRGNKFPGL